MSVLLKSFTRLILPIRYTRRGISCTLSPVKILTSLIAAFCLAVRALNPCPRKYVFYWCQIELKIVDAI